MNYSLNSWLCCKTTNVRFIMISGTCADNVCLCRVYLFLVSWDLSQEHMDWGKHTVDRFGAGNEGAAIP